MLSLAGASETAMLLEACWPFRIAYPFAVAGLRHQEFVLLHRREHTARMGQGHRDGLRRMLYLQMEGRVCLQLLLKPRTASLPVT